MSWKKNLKETLGICDKIVSKWTIYGETRYYVYLSGHIYKGLNCEKEIYLTTDFSTCFTPYTSEGLDSTKDNFMNFCNYWKTKHDIEIDGNKL